MKKALTIEQQLDKLKQRGMVFDDEQKAREILLDVGFYRLGFYSFPFERTFPETKNRTHKLKEGTKFTDVVDLYYFDYDLRHILLKALDRIEVNIRTTIVYIVSNSYSKKNTWFADTSIMNEKYVAKFDEKAYNQIKKNDVIIRHHKKYPNDRYAPAWKTIEFMTFGNVCYLFNALKDGEIQAKVAQHYGCSINVFLNYMNAIMTLRNTCAHGGCLYNISLSDGVKLKPANIPNEARQYVGGLIGATDYILGKVSVNRQADMEREVRTLYNRQTNPVIVKILERCAKIHLLAFVESK